MSNVKTINGLAYASVKRVDGLLHAPPALSSDTFNRADGGTVATALGSTDGAGTLDPLTWTKGFSPGVVDVQGLRINVNNVGNNGNDIATPHAYHIAYVPLGTGGVDLQANAVVVNSAGKSAGLLLRHSTDSNFWYVAFTGFNTVNLYKTVAGVETLMFTSTALGAIAGTMTATPRVVASGSTINVYSATTLLGSVTDSFNASAANHGIAMRNDPLGTLNSSILDSFSAVASDGSIKTIDGLA